MLMTTDKASLEVHALELAASKWGGVVDGRVVRSATAAQTGLTCSSAGSWCVVQADARQEKTALESLAERSVVAYRPIVVKEQVIRGRKIKSERSMFGMYFFAKCEFTEDNWHRIRTARGVRCILGSRSGLWLHVPDAAMDVVRAVEAAHSDIVVSSRFVYHFGPGDVVRIKNGPFAHFYAKLESAVDEHGRLTALVDLFGRETKVQFDANQIEA